MLSSFEKIIRSVNLVKSLIFLEFFNIRPKFLPEIENSRIPENFLDINSFKKLEYFFLIGSDNLQILFITRFTSFLFFVKSSK